MNGTWIGCFWTTRQDCDFESSILNYQPGLTVNLFKRFYTFLNFEHFRDYEDIAKEINQITEIRSILKFMHILYLLLLQDLMKIRKCISNIIILMKRWKLTLSGRVWTLSFLSKCLTGFFITLLWGIEVWGATFGRSGPNLDFALMNSRLVLFNFNIKNQINSQVLPISSDWFSAF